jgi:acetylornithine deacetylase
MALIETYPTPASLAAALIDLPSVTGSEKRVLAFLEERLVEIGCVTDREYIGADRWNLYGNWSDKTHTVFCTHVDTVPPHVPARMHDGVLYGRGACDTKGIIAAMLFAAERLIAAGASPSFLFVVGEETDSIGAKTAAQSPRTADFIIVGEPTDNLLASGHKGALSYTLDVHGHAAHSAYPERGSSAIHLLLDILQTIRGAAWGTHEILGPATINVGRIEGGTAMNTLASHATAQVMHRIVDDTEVRRSQVLDLIGDRATVRFHSDSQPQILYVPEGFEAKPVAFGSDIPYLRAIARCLLCGPGSVHDAHTMDECISVAALDEAVELYVRLFQALRTE